jgi:hypothetical protein
VNGDFFNLSSGYPSGAFLRGGVLATPPNPRRSALAIGLDGRLLVDLFRFDGTWQAGAGTPRRLHQVNRPLPDRRRVGLFTDAWGGPTPRARGAFEVVLAGFPKAALDADLTGTVVAVSRGGLTPIPRGGAVLQARGPARAALRIEAAIGADVTVRLGMAGLPPGTLDAVGGGPLLVRDGVPVRPTDEWFTLEQIARRHPRTAVGQLADGRLLFVVADGRSSRSYGLTTWALARALADLGAVTAMAFDGGGSSTLAFDGRVLNRPSDGFARSVASGLFLFYYGVYAPAAGRSALSPNGDGVGDRRVLAAKIVRRSELDLQLVRPDGSVAWSRREVVGPGWVRRVVRGPAMADGRWRWVVAATDATTGEESRMERAFLVNKTLGHLRISRATLRGRRGAPRRIQATVVLTRPAKLRVEVRSRGGRVRRVLFTGTRAAGRLAWRWNGRTAAGRRVAPGTYTVRVVAENELGSVALRRPVRVARRGPR